MRKVSEQTEQGFQLNLGQYWRVFWRKKYFLIVPLIISAVVSNVGIRFLVPIFESTSVIRVSDPSASRELQRFVLAEGPRRTRDADTAARLEADLMGSAFLDELIHHLGMDRDGKLIMAADEQRRNLYPGLTTEELVYRRLRMFLKRRIAVEREGPELFSITYSDANPEACYVIAETITQLYIQLQQRSRIEGLQEVSDFSEEQLAVYKERLNRSERALERLQKDIARRSAEANPVTAANIGMTETIRKELNVTIRATENTLEKIRLRLVEIVAHVPDGTPVWSTPEFRELERSLTSHRETELLRQLRGTTGAGGEASEVGSIIGAQQALQRYISGAVSARFASMNADYRPLVAEYFYQQADLGSLRDKHRNLVSYITAFRDRVAMEPQMKSELTSLQQEVEQNRTLYNTFQSSRTSTQISEAVQSTELDETIVVVEAASKPLIPVRPNRMKILALAVFFGLTIGGGGILLTEFSDSSFRSVDELERALDLKVLGTVPKFDRHGRWQPESARKKALLWTVTSIIVLTVSIAGFYFYGKSSRQQMLNINVTASSARGGK